MRRLSMLCAVAVLLASASTACAHIRQPPLRTVGDTNALPITDGTVAVLRPRADVVRAVDLATGTYIDRSLRSDCRVAAVRFGLVLAGCPEQEQEATPYGAYAIAYERPYFLTISSGAIAPIPVIPPGGDLGFYLQNVHFGAIGRYWLAGSVSCYHCRTTYLNWRTGVIGPGQSDLEDDVTSDIDSPDLRTVRIPPRFVRREVEGRYTLTGADDRESQLVLRGPRRDRLVLSRCADGCRNVGLLAGRVVWTEGKVVHAFVVRAGQRFAWALPALTTSPSAMVTLTATRHVLLLAAPTDDRGLAHRLWVIRWVT